MLLLAAVLWVPGRGDANEETEKVAPASVSYAHTTHQSLGALDAAELTRAISRFRWQKAVAESLEEGSRSLQASPAFAHELPAFGSFGDAGYRGVQSIICAKPWPCQEALAVAACESTMDPAASNSFGAGHYGLFQISGLHAGRVGGDLHSLLDPAVNVAVAYDIWDDQGWQPWSCRPY